MTTRRIAWLTGAAIAALTLFSARAVAAAPQSTAEPTAGGEGAEANTVVVTAEHPEDFIGVFSINYAATHYAFRNDQMNHLDGDKARLDIGREDLKVFKEGAETEPIMAKASATGFSKATDTHVENFLESIRTRKTPTAPIRLGFQAALVVQMANISLKTGRRAKWNSKVNKVELS